MNAAIAVFSHGKLPLLCIARQPGLLHTGLRVLLASKTRHYTVCVLEPWAVICHLVLKYRLTFFLAGWEATSGRGVHVLQTTYTR